VTRVWAAFNRHTFGHARRVVALGPTMRERICRTTGANPDRVAVVHNWQDGEFVRPLDKSENPFSAEHGLDAAFSLLYSGNIGGNHDLATLVHGAAALRDAEDPVRVLVVGEGDERDAVVALAAELEAENVAFLPYQPRAVLPHSLTSADVSVVAVERGMEGVCVSSKLYTALAAGKPVLAIASHRDDVGRLVAEFDVGRVVRQGDVAGLVAAVREWQADPALLARQGVNARTAFEAHFTRDRSVDAYYRLLVEE
jgi:glycosyltransferase involved in cell wall biosynthesis